MCMAITKVPMDSHDLRDLRQKGKVIHIHHNYDKNNNMIKGVDKVIIVMMMVCMVQLYKCKLLAVLLITRRNTLTYGPRRREL